MFGLAKNVGMFDRIIRVALGAAIIVAGYLYLADWQSIVAYIIGAGTFITGVVGFCSVYKLLGISTAKCAHCETPPISQPPNPTPMN